MFIDICNIVGGKNMKIQKEQKMKKELTDEGIYSIASDR